MISAYIFLLETVITSETFATAGVMFSNQKSLFQEDFLNNHLVLVKNLF